MNTRGLFKTNPWKRKGFYYYAYLALWRTSGDRHSHQTTIEKKLFFITYHLIKFIHGEQGLIDMASRFTIGD